MSIEKAYKEMMAEKKKEPKVTYECKECGFETPPDEKGFKPDKCTVCGNRHFKKITY